MEGGLQGQWRKSFQLAEQQAEHLAIHFVFAAPGQWSMAWLPGQEPRRKRMRKLRQKSGVETCSWAYINGDELCRVLYHILIFTTGETLNNKVDKVT
jgi:hypothetical protein